MSTINILTTAEQKAFDSPPIFTADEHHEFFSLDETLKAMLAQLGSPLNQVGFLLQFGYFKATGRFYRAKYFTDTDVEHVCVLLDVADQSIDIHNYKGRTFRRHQERISRYFNLSSLTKHKKINCKHR